MSYFRQHNTGLQRLTNALNYSYNGFLHAYRYEQAFRQESWLFLPLTAMAIWLGESAVECVILISSLILVLIVELLNSAIEATVDRISEEQHLLSGIAKDIASAAVFLSLANVVISWSIILLF